MPLHARGLDVYWLGGAPVLHAARQSVHARAQIYAERLAPSGIKGG
jgi:hypothetical protein